MNRMFSPCFGILLWVLSAGWSCAQTTISPPSAVNQFSEDPCLSSAGIGISVFDLQSDSFITEHDGALALPPASTLKVLTTAAALKILGSDFRFCTEVAYSGTIKADTLVGDLLLVGKGDPTLGSSHFSYTHDSIFSRKVKQTLHRIGVAYVSGRIVGDASFYQVSTIPRTWPYQDLGNYYGAFCAGLNYHDNLHFLTFKQQTQPNALVTKFSIYPTVPGLKIESFVSTGAIGSGDQAYIMGAPFQNNRFVIGTIPPGKSYFTIKGSVPDPALFCANALTTYLETNNISVKGSALSAYLPTTTDLKIMDTIWSPTLIEIIKTTNQKSVNLYAEALGQYISKMMPLQQSDNMDWLKAYWTGQGIDLSGANFADFSGLAPDNAISSRTMVRILESIFDGPPQYWDQFLESMAIAGVSGTMRSFLSQSEAKGRVFAKSGLIGGVRNYCGYILGSQNNWYAFSIFTHNATCSGQQLRKKLEQLLETLYLSLSKNSSK